MGVSQACSVMADIAHPDPESAGDAAPHALSAFISVPPRSNRLACSGASRALPHGRRLAARKSAPGAPEAVLPGPIPAAGAGALTLAGPHAPKRARTPRQAVSHTAKRDADETPRRQSLLHAPVGHRCLARLVPALGGTAAGPHAPERGRTPRQAVSHTAKRDADETSRRQGLLHAHEGHPAYLVPALGSTAAGPHAPNRRARAGRPP